VTFDRISWPRRTDRITIRPATTADLSAVFAVRSLPDVAEWMPDLPTSYDDWLLQLGRSGAVGRMLVMEVDGTVIGDLYLHVEDAWTQVEVKEAGKQAQAEIGWCLSPDHQGRGYVTEAMVELERLGMTREALNRADSLHRDHGWIDGVTYALLREDWKG
jgi:RimJ/RimL family protein N-acetyltransferase